jgi:predicted ATPase
MLSKFKVQRYKSLFDTEIELEPLTVFIGPNGSGKSNICEALAVLSNFLGRLVTHTSGSNLLHFFLESLRLLNKKEELNIEPKFWHGEKDYLLFEVRFFLDLYSAEERLSYTLLKKLLNLSIQINFIPPSHPNTGYMVNVRSFDHFESFKLNHESTYNESSQLKEFLISNQYVDSPLATSLKKVDVYDFFPMDLSTKTSSTDDMDRTGKGITNSLVDILHENRENFAELEERLTRLVPNIKRISLPRGKNQTFELELIDKYSEHHIPATEISDGTLRILGFLTALYQKEAPSIICFEELENGVHPWLLHKMMELLKIVSTEGINGKPVQVLITTHSPLLLNYFEPYQVRAVELDGEGKTQVHKLPIDSVRFQKALEAYDGELGELWFTNVFGGNPA